MREQGGPPANVTEFVLRHLDTVAALEALLMLRAAPDQAWSAAQVGTRLYVSETAAGTVLRSLHRHGLLANDDLTYRYGPATDALRTDVEALAAAYTRFLIPITHLIHSKPSAALRDFADAFKLREED